MKNNAKENVPGNGQNQFSNDDPGLHSREQQPKRHQSNNDSKPIWRIPLLALLVLSALGYSLWCRSGNNAGGQAAPAGSMRHAALLPELNPAVAPVRAAAPPTSKPVRAGGIINSASIAGAGRAATEKTRAATEKTKGWVYDSEAADEGTFHFAIVASNEVLKLRGTSGSQAELSVRERGGLNEVYLQIDKGAFLMNNHEAIIKAGFDGEELQPITCVSSQDSDPTMLFIDSTAPFITRLKTATTLVIDVNIKHNGTQRLTFDVSNLKWNH